MFLLNREEVSPRILSCRLLIYLTGQNRVHTLAPISQLSPWGWTWGHLSVSGKERARVAFKANKGPAVQKSKGWVLCGQPTVSAMGRSRCHTFVFSLTGRPRPVLARKIRDSTNSCGIALNRKLPCGREKIVSIITEWHNWTRVRGNRTEGQEIQTDAKEHLAEELRGAPVQAVGWPRSQFLSEGAGPGPRAALLPTGPAGPSPRLTPASGGLWSTATHLLRLHGGLWAGGRCLAGNGARRGHKQIYRV